MRKKNDDEFFTVKIKKKKIMGDESDSDFERENITQNDENTEVTELIQNEKKTEKKSEN